MSIFDSGVYENALSQEEYDLVMEEIKRNHFFNMFPFPPNHKAIKYVRPNWDMRDGKCFSIEFDNMKFHQSDGKMFDLIMNWLRSE